MANWYVSSVSYAAISPFAPSHSYSIGDIVRQIGANATITLSSLTSVTTTATATTGSAHGFITGQTVTIAGAVQTNYNKTTTITVTGSTTFTYAITATTSPATGTITCNDYVASGNERAFRCTTSGTSAASEPAWTLTKAATTTSSGAVFTEVTGNNAYGWSAAAAKYQFGWPTNGDVVYFASDHTETTTGAILYSTSFLQYICISVSRAGSVPPVVADITPGATIIGATVGIVNFTFSGETYWEGFTFKCGGASNSPTLAFGGINGGAYFKNCAFELLSTNASCTINSNVVAYTVWDNCTFKFAATNQGLANGSAGRFLWKNTPNAIQGAVIPTYLFTGAGSKIDIRGVDLSAINTNLVYGTGVTYLYMDISDCKLNAAAAISSSLMSYKNAYINVVNCDSGGTTYQNSFYCYAGSATTEQTYVRSGGASDGIKAVSHKLVSNINCVFPLVVHDSPVYLWNTTTGSSKTATIEVCANTVLYNDELYMDLEYPGASTSPLSSSISNNPATVLSTHAAQTTSSHTFADWSAASFNSDDITNGVLSNNNLTLTKNAASGGGARSFCYVSSGLYYFETTIGTTSTTLGIGIGNLSFSMISILGGTVNSLGYVPNSGIVKINNSTLSTIMTATSGDIIGMAVDLTHSKIWIRKNGGNWNNDVIGNQNPATNTGGISLSTLAAGPYNIIATDNANGTAYTINTGATSFNATAPAGFSAFGTHPTQKLVTSFTPQLQGLLRAQVKLQKTSATVYVDPFITLV